MTSHGNPASWFLRRLFALGTLLPCLCNLAALGQGDAGNRVSKSSDGDGAAVVHTFDVVSIRPSKPNGEQGMQLTPSGYIAKGFPLMVTLTMAYLPVPFPPGDPFVGTPIWVKQDRYDIEAKVTPADEEEWAKQDLRHKDLAEAMLRTALAERCKLILHTTGAEVQGYALVIGSHGPKLQEASPDEAFPPNAMQLPYGGVMTSFHRGEKPEQKYFGASMASLAQRLGLSSGGHPVLDRTGLTGRYDFVLPKRDTAGESPSDPGLTNLWDLDALGLKLQPIKVPGETLVIDHIEKPSSN